MTRSSSISFCMIVRDGGEPLRACLESVAPVVDEMVVIDTGSVDGSPDLARAFGARVLSVSWRDDFAAARNEYLRVARAPWVLSLDADEQLDAAEGASLREHVASHPRSAFVFTIRNYFFSGEARGEVPPAAYGGEALPGVGFTLSRTVRLFPRRAGVEYRYPIHESLLPALRRHRIGLRPTSVPIHHLGYLYARDGLAAKAAAYRELAKKKLAAYPGYFLAHLEMGKIHLRDGELDEADGCFERALRLSPRCSRAHYYLALSRLRRDDPAGAMRHLRRGLAITPGHSDMRELRRELETRLRGSGGGSEREAHGRSGTPWWAALLPALRHRA